MVVTLLKTRSLASGFEATAYIGCEMYDGVAQKATAEKMVSAWGISRQDAKETLEASL